MSTLNATAPKVGFVSLGCPKALTDSELILTQLSAEGYQTSKTFQGADLVIINTCGFIDAAKEESFQKVDRPVHSIHLNSIIEAIIHFSHQFMIFLRGLVYEGSWADVEAFVYPFEHHSGIRFIPITTFSYALSIQ